MTTAQKSVEVNVPITTVYNQWTQFEEFPRFMSDVESVIQSGDRHMHRRVKIAGIERDFYAEITEQHPEELEMEPEGFVETVADKTGYVGRTAERDLKNFKFIESRGGETGAWRGDNLREG